MLRCFEASWLDTDPCQKSAKSRDNPKRDWYIWKDSRGKAEDGTPLPPNNWAQIFDSEHSAWNYDKTTDQWYLVRRTFSSLRHD